MNGLLYFLGLVIWTAAILLVTKDMHIIPAMFLIWGSLAIIYVGWIYYYRKQERNRDGRDV